MIVYFSITMRFGLNSGGLSHNFCEFNHHGIVYLKQAMRLQMGESNCSRNCLLLLCPSMLEGFSSNIMYHTLVAKTRLTASHMFSLWIINFARTLGPTFYWDLHSIFSKKRYVTLIL